ncbi:hypothetical protein T479_16960 [Lysinibacillus varians]|nr:hypothetical protein T479_16960 [Lysinibacillus varians]
MNPLKFYLIKAKIIFHFFDEIPQSASLLIGRDKRVSRKAFTGKKHMNSSPAGQMDRIIRQGFDQEATLLIDSST